jgi:uncharacterized protein
VFTFSHGPQKPKLADSYEDILKIRIAAPPVDGQANAELSRFLARQFETPQNHEQVKAGQSLRWKRVFIRGKTINQMIGCLPLITSSTNL